MNPHTATEAIYSATYVDNYIDSVENLPDDVQRHLSRIRDIDVQYRNHLREVDHFYEVWKSKQNPEVTTSRHTKLMNRIQSNLCRAQELGDEKMQIVNQLQELIDQKTRQLDIDQKNLDIKEDMQHNRYDGSQQVDDCGVPIPSKQARTQSPGRSDQIGGGVNNGGIGAAARSGSCSAGGSTPNSERSGHIGNSNNATNGVGGIGNNAGSENQRYANKRSRRRNDTAVGNMDFGGNESNSANETGSVGGSGLERNLSQKSNHKKSHGQGGNAGNAVCASSSGTSGANTGKKKKRKARGGQSAAIANAREETPPPDPIDPDEPTYCVCNQISFGEMILCDNDLCPIEWFHFSCVSLVLKPKGKWYCPNCRGDRPNVMKPKAQFLKELERYNKEKEEKT